MASEISRISTLADSEKILLSRIRDRLGEFLYTKRLSSVCYQNKKRVWSRDFFRFMSQRAKWMRHWRVRRKRGSGFQRFVSRHSFQIYLRLRSIQRQLNRRILTHFTTGVDSSSASLAKWVMQRSSTLSIGVHASIKSEDRSSPKPKQTLTKSLFSSPWI